MASAIEPLLRLPTTGRPGSLSMAMLLGIVRLLDAALLLGAGLLACGVLSGRGPSWLPLVMAMGTLVAINLLTLSGAYSLACLRSLPEQAVRIAAACACALLLLAGLERALGLLPTPWPVLGGWLLAGVVALLLARSGLLLLLRRSERLGHLAQCVVVIGASEHGRRLVERLRLAGPAVRLIGLFDDRRTRVPSYVGGYPVLGGIDDLLALARRHPIDQVIIALPWDAETRLLECLRRLRDLPVNVRLCPDRIGFHLSHRGVTHLAGVPLLNVFEKPLPGWAYLAKAIEDRLLAAVVLLLTAPLLLGIALAIRLTSGGPVLFRQTRYGLNNEPIEVLKFRTMAGPRGEAESFRQTEPNDPRVTPIGRLLRRTSLDELPQFLNVLRGEMSVVGPRPHAVAQNEAMAPLIDAYLARHRVKPGITGWAQIHGLRGRTETLEKMERRLELDLYYIENWSVGFDARIILRTMFVGFAHPNAY